MNLHDFKFSQMAVQKDSCKEVRKVFQHDGLTVCFAVYQWSWGTEFSVSIGTWCAAFLTRGGLFTPKGNRHPCGDEVFETLPELMEAITDDLIPSQILNLLEKFPARGN